MRPDVVVVLTILCAEFVSRFSQSMGPIHDGNLEKELYIWS